MTPKEALHILNNTIIHFARGNGKSVCFGALAKAAEALENAERYKWHDLRENPEDLPPCNKDVLVCCVNQSGKKAQFVMWYNELEGWLFQNYKPCCEQIAWREIEPFEEDNE